MQTHLIFLVLITLLGCCSQGKQSSEQPQVVATEIPQAWVIKKDQGVDFLALGTEPFWSLEVDFEQSMHMKVISGDSLTLPIEDLDRNEEGWSLASEMKQIQVMIRQDSCSDHMSDRVYRYTVRVAFLGENYEGCGVRLSETNPFIVDP